MFKHFRTILLVVLLVAVMAAGSPLPAPQVVQAQSSHYTWTLISVQHATYVLACTSTPQDLIPSPGPIRAIQVYDITIAPDTTCVISGTITNGPIAGNSRPAFGGPQQSYSALYVAPFSTGVVSETLRVSTSTAATLYVTINYGIYQ